jgi:hypothetical protein
MAEEAKKTESARIGIAALIASIGIPLAQLLVGFFSQQTTQLQNIALEKERRRLEVTKLFLDNYVGKKTDVQIATIQIMKSLDPVFFISIEEGLKETTHSDTVKASIRRATVDAATEVSTESGNSIKNKKIQKVLSAKHYEEKGNEHFARGDLKSAKIEWQKADQEFPLFKDEGSFRQSGFSSGFSEDFSSDKKMRKAMQKDLNRLQDSLTRALKKQMESMN